MCYFAAATSKRDYCLFANNKLETKIPLSTKRRSRVRIICTLIQGKRDFFFRSLRYVTKLV